MSKTVILIHGAWLTPAAWGPVSGPLVKRKGYTGGGATLAPLRTVRIAELPGPHPDPRKDDDPHHRPLAEKLDQSPARKCDSPHHGLSS